VTDSTTTLAATPTPPPAEPEADSLEIQVACMRRALLSLGSAIMAGGPPGPQGYIAWHNAEIAKTPMPRPLAMAPAWAKLRTDGPTLEEFVAAGYLADAYPPPGYEAKLPPAPVEVAPAPVGTAVETPPTSPPPAETVNEVPVVPPAVPAAEPPKAT
jgi:hypothetical protein